MIAWHLENGRGAGSWTLPPPIAALFVAGGLALLGWIGWESLGAAPAPYGYKLVSEGADGEFPDLGLDFPSPVVIRRHEVHAGGVADPVAVLHTAQSDGGDPVLLDWRNLASEPVLFLGAPARELGDLARVVSEHVPRDAPVLAWWDISRQLELLAGTRAFLPAHLGQPLLLPEPWRGQRAVIEGIEQAQWNAVGYAQVHGQFELFIDALASNLPEGVTKLRALTGDRDGYLVLHVTDAYRLGALRPERFGVGFKDFPRTGNTHKMVGNVKGWLKTQGYGAYTVDPASQGRARVYFLTNEATKVTLLARALPFNTSTPMDLPGLQLSYQKGGFWVYKF